MDEQVKRRPGALVVEAITGPLSVGNCWLWMLSREFCISIYYFSDKVLLPNYIGGGIGRQGGSFPMPFSNSRLTRPVCLVLVLTGLVCWPTSVAAQLSCAGQAQNFWFDLGCYWWETTACGNPNVDVCEYHECRDGACYGYLHNCVGLGWACVFFGCNWWICGGGF